jgi:antitoxin MazE
MRRVTAKVQKWGNNLAVIIPLHIAKQASIRQGSEVEMIVENHALRLEPKRKKPTLKEMLKGYSPEKNHKEIDFGGPVGKELL